MKKLFVLLFSLFYLVLSSGFTQYLHICKGAAVKLASLTNSEHQNSDKPCSICTNKEKDLTKKKIDCCQHETTLLKVDEGVKKQFQFDYSVKFWGNAIPNKMLGSVFDFSIIADDTGQSSLYLTSKTPIRDNPLYVLHCVYRI